MLQTRQESRAHAAWLLCPSAVCGDTISQRGRIDIIKETMSLVANSYRRELSKSGISTHNAKEWFARSVRVVLVGSQTVLPTVARMSPF